MRCGKPANGDGIEFEKAHYPLCRRCTTTVYKRFQKCMADYDGSWLANRRAK